MQYTKNGKSFGTFPVPWWIKEIKVRCLESLDNGGDFFVAGSESAYIFRHADSTWEKQPDVPVDVDQDDCKLNKSKSHQIFSYAQFSTVHVCGTVRPDPGSSVEEIVVLVGDRERSSYGYIRWDREYNVYIFNIASSSWRAGENSLNLHAYMSLK